MRCGCRSNGVAYFPIPPTESMATKHCAKPPIPKRSRFIMVCFRRFAKRNQTACDGDSLRSAGMDSRRLRLPHTNFAGCKNRGWLITIASSAKPPNTPVFWVGNLRGSR